MSDVTLILQQIESGDGNAGDLLTLVYEELRQMAARRMQVEPNGHSLQPTALVHEAYLRLLGDGNSTWQNRRHFFGAAAIAMQRILVENARRRSQTKRGGNLQRIDFADAQLVSEVAANDAREAVDLIALNTALTEFESADPQKAELVRLRFFAGLSEEEACQTLNISRATASRWWAYSRAWLFSKMKDE
ncbi:MAG: ECF-type sigma factor [Planctomycetaceae bacterium]